MKPPYAQLSEQIPLGACSNLVYADGGYFCEIKGLRVKVLSRDVRNCFLNNNRDCTYK